MIRKATIVAFITAYTAISVNGIDARENNRHKPGCNTYKCDRRTMKKAHKKTLKRWKKTVRPYRGWLRSTGNCETRGLPNHGYTANTGNGFYGRYQFTMSSWRAVGGRGMPHQAAPIEQDVRAVRLLWKQGRGAWPVCG